MDFFRRIFGKQPPQPDADQQTTPHQADAATEGVHEAVQTAGEPSVQEEYPPPISTVDGATRPLTPEALISTQNKHIIFGQSTDVGMVRNTNQDSALSFYFTSRSAEERPDFGLFILADGMGGHLDGEKASAITTRALALRVTNNIYLPLLASHDKNTQPDISKELTTAAQEANTAVMKHVKDGGTTLTAVAVVNNQAYIVHVGDSRAYLITSEEIEQVTRDHSLVQRLLELDQITPEEAAEHPQKNVLYRALGQNEILEVDILTRRLPPNSSLLLCSDGLWSHVEDPEIFRVINDHSNPQEACDKLVALANTYGGTDNITTILLQVPSNAG